MGIEKTKKCAQRIPATLEDNSHGLPKRCRAKGCTGIFKIDEDTKCNCFIDEKEAIRKHRQRKR